MNWFKVLSSLPICVNHQNGSVVAMPRGKVFEADENLADVRRLLKLSPPAIVMVPAPFKTDLNTVPAPGPSYPIPANSSPPPPKLPDGVHELVTFKKPAQKG